MTDLENAKVILENKVLREEIDKLHRDWAYDANRLLDLKEENKKLVYDYNNLEFLYKQLKHKYEDLLEDFNEYRNKLEYCRDCQV